MATNQLILVIKLHSHNNELQGNAKTYIQVLHNTPFSSTTYLNSIKSKITYSSEASTVSLQIRDGKIQGK